VRPLAEFPVDDRRNIQVLLSDIDDTMTTDGRLPAATLGALEDLAAAGIKLVPVTGRPAGWCDHIARMWPVDAVIGENGAMWFSYDRKTRKMHSHFVKSDQERNQDRARLDALQNRILDAVPGAGIASDQFCRIADLAIDFCEDVDPLPQSAIDKIVAMFEDAGAVAKVSSIHVNGWFGDYDKKSMTAHCMSKRFGLDIAADNAKLVFAGDSPNDQPMFEHFTHSVGVANVRDFNLDHPPRWVTQNRAGAGFVELAAALMQTR